MRRVTSVLLVSRNYYSEGVKMSSHVPDQINFPQEEERTLKLWKELDAFQTSLKQSKDRPRYTFYDGPPFATGLPHYGHILAGTIKDTVTRYAHQTGHHVERRFGWDCHGLPVEYEIDKTLGIKGPQDVQAMGIGEYNKQCRKIVMRYSTEWEEIVTRLGRWIDFKNDYKTLYPWFMESIWWVFKQLYDKGLVYRGYKVVCVGSIAELEELSGVKINDLHWESVDTITIPSKTRPGTTLHRITKVFDCWFESGSMPYAQSHYPFENKKQSEATFPADFIAEGVDQTRGWIKVLHFNMMTRPLTQAVTSWTSG